MKFIEVKIYTSHQGVEPLTAMLMEKGITLDEAKKLV